MLAGRCIFFYVYLYVYILLLEVYIQGCVFIYDTASCARVYQTRAGRGFPARR